MSLKAKLEAVIYAAEEPVTLTQLTALFADEALEWKAEREAAAEAGKPVDAGAAEDATQQLNEAFPYLELEPVVAGETSAAAAEEQAEPATESVAPADEPPSEDGEASGAGTVAEGGDATGEAAGTSAEAASEAGEQTGVVDEAQAEAEAKRAARQREREASGVIRQLLEELIAEYSADARGIEIREIAGGYRMATKPEFHDAVRSFVKSQKPPLKLSIPALETLAVIAYKQPVTAPEVNEIRGVDASAVFGSLLARKLITTAGRKPVIGRPILYKTTREFLLRFGLRDVSELPSMEEFEKMAASELEESAGVAEDEAAAPAAEEFNADMSVEAEETNGEGAAETNSEHDAATKGGASDSGGASSAE
ncbi:MAG: SMC-Scp complex subunit ScpB [Terracidiphilus sp.]|jgi:segregation and condensation protein B